MSAGDWYDRAACRDADAALFFAPGDERDRERESREARAKRICAGCPARVECLEFAVATVQKAGVWGGMTEDERAREHRRRRRRAASAAARRAAA